MKVFENILYTSVDYPVTKAGSRTLLDLCLPDDCTDSTPVVVWFHGGGITGGDKNGDPGSIVRKLAESGIAAASCNYRLYPDAKYPDFLVDAAEAVAWCRANMPKYSGIDGWHGKVFAGGESAGAYITQMLCFDKTWLGRFGIDPDTEIAGWIHGGGQPTAHFNVLAERGIDPKRVRVDERAPLFHIDRSTFAPMVLLTSTKDIPGRMRQNQLVEATLRHFGFTGEIDLRIIEGQHCSYCHPNIDDGIIPVVEIMKEFVGKYR